MNFAEAAKNKAAFTRTENGAVALNTTGNSLVDFFGSVGSLRNASEDRVTRLFAEAYKEDPLVATKISFYARDIRGGAGERKTFRTLIKYMAEYHPEAITPNIQHIEYFGRWDDLYSLVGTPVEDKMWSVMKEQFEADRESLEADQPVSLLAKWIKTADASTKSTRELGILTAHKLGYQVNVFKRLVRAMRKKIRITEALMSANQWNEIDYSAVPSRASMIYRNAFERHDPEGYKKFVKKALNGEAKINSSTLYPYDLIDKIWNYWNIAHTDDTVEAQWRQLPNYISEGTNALVMADTSGSMHGRPMATSVGLAIYFAERNKGAYHNMWMSFSSNPKIHVLKGETLAQKINNLETQDWDMNTDLKKAFNLVLDIAVQNNIPQDEMPKSIIVISDMEIDKCGNREWTFYEKMEHKFQKRGYQIPNIVFWNVNSRHDIFHADSKRKGVQLISGSSISAFKNLMKCVDMTPEEAMYTVINDERYDIIIINQD